MRLRSLALRNFAGSLARDVDGLAPGLNVVVGDNEAGKSTLLMALRAALFQRHKSQTAIIKDLAPHGRQVRPEVVVEFDTGGESYRLRKSFLQRAEAELVWASGSLSGEAVEERLAELFRFSHSGARKRTEGDYPGAFGLLWADQGRAYQGLDLGAGRDAVAASLEGEVAQVLGGDRGRALLLAAKTRHDRFFTDRGRTSVHSPLKAAEDRLVELRRALAEKEVLAADYGDKIDRLHRQRERLRALDRDDALAIAERALRSAEAAFAAMDQLQREVDEARRALRQAELAREASAERLARRRTLIEASAKAEKAREASGLALREVEARVAGASEALTRLQATREEAARREAALASEAAEATNRAERGRRTVALAAAQARLSEADALRAALGALAPPVAGLNAAFLRDTERLERAARDAAIRRDAASPVLNFHPEAGRSLRVDGEEWSLDAPLRVTRPARVELEGFGAIEIEPGGDGDALRDVAERAARALGDHLRPFRLADADEARRLVRRSEDEARERDALDKRIRVLAPEGLGVLRERVNTERNALGPEGPQDATGMVDPAAWDAARRALGEAEARVGAARDALSRLREALAGARSESAHAHAEAARLEDELLEGERERPLTALEAAHAGDDTERAGRAHGLAQRREALDAADPEAAGRLVETKRRALHFLREDQAKLVAEVAALEGELGAGGLVSLDGEIDRLRAEIEQGEGERARLALEAEASRLLLATLGDAQRAARESWLGPIKQRVGPYLRLLHPDSDVEFDEETLEIAALRRRGVEESFRSLSMGAREQVAVVTRLALAEVLKRGGHPAAVILDDALVNTDEVRLERMHRALHRAADNGLQVIVLTCRERDFRDLGAPIIRL